MKKALQSLRNISIAVFVVLIIYALYNGSYFWQKLSYICFVFSAIIVIVELIYAKTTKTKTDIGTATALIYVLFVALSLFAPYFSTNKKADFDTMTEAGKLQNEIQEQFGVNVFYNTEIPNNKYVVYLEDYHISEDDAVKDLKIIKEVLSFYSGKMPNAVYILNRFKDNEETTLGGLFIGEDNLIILKNSDNIGENFHHEIGHLIHMNTFEIKSLNSFENVDSSCGLVSTYACTNSHELFAETWKTALIKNKTTDFSLALSDVFKENLKYLQNPNYVEVDEIEESFKKLLDGEIESFVVKTDENINLGKILITYPMANNVNRLNLGDETLFYVLKV